MILSISHTYYENIGLSTAVAKTIKLDNAKEYRSDYNQNGISNGVETQNNSRRAGNYVISLLIIFILYLLAIMSVLRPIEPVEPNNTILILQCSQYYQHNYSTKEIPINSI